MSIPEDIDGSQVPDVPDEKVQEVAQRGTFSVQKVGKHIFQPLLEQFDRGDMIRAVEEELYLPEVTVVFAADMMKYLKEVCSNYTDSVIDNFHTKMLLKWMKENMSEKYEFFTCGGEKQEKRLKWLRWNVDGFKTFLIGED